MGEHYSPVLEKHQWNAVLGILIIMRYIGFPTLEWLIDNGNFASSIVHKVILRDCFRQLLTCLHVNAINSSLVTCVQTYEGFIKDESCLTFTFDEKKMHLGWCGYCHTISTSQC